MASDDNAADAAGWIENTAPTSRFAGLGLRQPWDHRELIFFFALRDVKVRYKQAFLGAAWAALTPLAGALAFTLVFNKLADIEVPRGTYFTFALSGFVVWSYFSAAISSGLNSLVQNSELLTKVAFPRIVLPFGAVLPPIVDLSFGAVIALVAAIVTGDGFSPAGFLIGLPLGLALLLATVLGPVLLLSALTVKYRDVGAVAVFGLQFVLFASPVAYPAELVSGGWRDVYYLNPIAGALGLLRAALVNGQLPAAGSLLLSAATAVTLLFLGLAYFHTSARYFADIV